MLNVLLVAFMILGVCLVIHIAGIVYLAERLVRHRERLVGHSGFWRSSSLLIVVFSIVIVLHIFESCIWAAFYTWHGLFANFETSLYYSMKSYSTVGYGDVLLPNNWRLLGTFEAISGVLLCGLSAAFLFAIVNALFRIRVNQDPKVPKLRAP